MKTICKTIFEYNQAQPTEVQEICDFLEIQINKNLKKSESKIWHGSPVWFMAGNPIVAYSVRKDSRVSLMFFSGQSFDEMDLKPEGKFKAAEIFYTNKKEIKVANLKRWLKKSTDIQWDYKNIVRRKGALEKILTAPTAHDQRFANMTFASVYPLYITKVEKKGRTKKELDQVIQWLTGFDDKKLKELIKEKVTFEIFFKKAKLNKNAHLITGVICGYRVEEIKDPLTQKVRYLDKLIDELAKGRKMEKIFRK